MHRHAGRQRQRRRGVAQGVQAPGRRPLNYLSDVLADPTLSGGLARLAMRRALRRIRQHRDVGVLLERLEGVDEPPWAELRAAPAG